MLFSYLYLVWYPSFWSNFKKRKKKLLCFTLHINTCLFCFTFCILAFRIFTCHAFTYFTGFIFLGLFSLRKCLVFERKMFILTQYNRKKCTVYIVLFLMIKWLHILIKVDLTLSTSWWHLIHTNLWNLS